MIKEESSKAWIVIIVAIIGATGVICAAIIALGTPFAERYAEMYFSSLTPVADGSFAPPSSQPTSQTSETLVPTETQWILIEPTIDRVDTAIYPAEPQPAPTFSSPCSLQFIDYVDTRSEPILQNGFDASIGHNDDGSVKIFLTKQGELYRNYYLFFGECTQDEKIVLLKQQFQVIENNTRIYVPSFRLKEPVIVP
jgi:hypothetical protein